MDRLFLLAVPVLNRFLLVGINFMEVVVEVLFDVNILNVLLLFIAA